MAYEVKIWRIDGAEFHQVGKFVTLRVPLAEEGTRTRNQRGEWVEQRVWRKSGAPVVVFDVIAETVNGEGYLKSGSTLDGGIRMEQLPELILELTHAMGYATMMWGENS